MPEQHDEAVMEAPPPPPDHDLTWRQHFRRNRRSLELTALILILFGINLFWNSYTASRVQNAAESAISKACDFWYPLTSIPVTSPPGAKKPTKLGVTIIAGARESYKGQCDPPHPPLPPPPPSLVRWAAYYHVPVAR